jgi:hypothetical protein
MRRLVPLGGGENEEEEGEAGEKAGFGAIEDVVPGAAERGAPAGADDGDDGELKLHSYRGVDEDSEKTEAEADEEDLEGEVADGEAAFELHAVILTQQAERNHESDESDE